MKVVVRADCFKIIYNEKMHLNKNEAYEQAHIGAQAAELLDKKVSQL